MGFQLTSLTLHESDGREYVVGTIEGDEPGEVLTVTTRGGSWRIERDGRIFGMSAALADTLQDAATSRFPHLRHRRQRPYRLDVEEIVRNAQRG